MAPLTDTELGVLRLEAKITPGGAKESAALTQLGLTPTAYYTLLARLISRPEALQFDPQLIKRLWRLQDRRLALAGRQRMEPSTSVGSPAPGSNESALIVGSPDGGPDGTRTRAVRSQDAPTAAASAVHTELFPTELPALTDPRIAAKLAMRPSRRRRVGRWERSQKGQIRTL